MTVPGHQNQAKRKRKKKISSFIGTMEKLKWNHGADLESGMEWEWEEKESEGELEME